VGGAALKAGSNKMERALTNDNQNVFISFAFDTFRFLPPKAANLLKRVQ
jgi:hypothetical protein